MSEVERQSTASVYGRLARYVRPYRKRLAIGLVAGLCFGSSVIGLLSAVSDIINSFEAPAEAAPQVQEQLAEAAPEPTDEMGVVGKAARRLGVTPVDDGGRMTWQFLLLSLLLVPLIVAVRVLGEYLNRYCMRWVSARVVRDLRDDLFRRLGAQSLKYFGRCDVGQLISKCTNDATIVEHVFASTVSDATRAPFDIIFAMGWAVVFSSKRGILGPLALMLVSFPLLVVPVIILGHYVRRYTTRALRGVSELVSRMHENFTCIRVVKAFHMENREAERFSDLNRKYFKSIVKALRAELLMTPLMQGVGILLGGALFVVCYAYEVKLSQIIPVGLAAVIIYRPVKQLARLNTNLQKGAAALERMFDVLDTDTQLKEAENPVTVGGVEEGFVFDHVDFSYGEESSVVLRDICLEVPKGHLVALVGQTGTGKTTVANLLARFYDPTGGKVLLDGTDLREVETASFRKLIGVVTQETVLFNDSIAYNIAYGTDGATREEIIEAAKKANAHEFIMADEAGYERIVGEKGFVLSGGERQRIAIARAILKNPPVLILDEAMSALDTVTERLVQEAIERVMEDRTVLAIAHRLSTVRNANRIVLLDNGVIAETGTHQELYDAGGRYRELCDMQVLDD